MSKKLDPRFEKGREIFERVAKDHFWTIISECLANAPEDDRYLFCWGYVDYLRGDEEDTYYREWNDEQMAVEVAKYVRAGVTAEHRQAWEKPVERFLEDCGKPLKVLSASEIEVDRSTPVYAFDDSVGF